MSTKDRDWMKDEPEEPRGAPVDPLPQMIHDLDQGLAMLPHWARAVRGYYDALLNEGFTPHQALYYLALKDRSDARPDGDS